MRNNENDRRDSPSIKDHRAASELYKDWRDASEMYEDSTVPGEADETVKRALKHTGRMAIRIIVALIILALGCTSIVATYPNEYNAILQFGQIVKIYDEPGLGWKIPLIQSTRSIPKQKVLYDLPVSDVITRDKKTMSADSFVLWQVEDPLVFMRTLSGSIPNANARNNAAVYNSMKNVIGGITQEEMISGRDTLAQAISNNLGDSLSQYGIRVTGFETKRLDLPSDNKEAVFTRMISERNNIAAAYIAEGESEATKIRTETDTEIRVQVSKAKADAEAMIAQGEAEYMVTLASAYATPERAEFYNFIRALDAAKITMNGGDKILFLDKDSPLVSIFYGG